MADYDIFREQLAITCPAYGHALWEPSPSHPEKPVQVGDVGLIREGKFHRLFNALLSADDPSHEDGVPEYHEPLVPNLRKHLYERFLDPNYYCSDGVCVERDPGHHSSQGDIPQFTFKFNKTRAAVLSLPVKARREDTRALNDFGSWIVKHIDSWFAFAQKLGLRIQRREEIILVTGYDRTKSWANIAFSGHQADSQVSFGVRAENSDPPVPSDPTITFQSSPEKAQGVVLHCGPKGKNLPENQCVFIRGYRVARTFWKLPKRLKAAAGPSSDPEGYDCDPDMEVLSVPAISKYRDPLYLLIDYVAEQASDCDMVLAHDDDLVKINGLGHDSSLETLEPEVMTDLLQRSNMEIREVPYVSATNSGTDNDTSVVKIAMLSMKSQNWDIDLSCASELRVPGGFPVPMNRGHTSALKTALPTDHGDAMNPTLQNLSRLEHATKHIVLALHRIGNELSNIWSSVSKFAHVERNTLMIVVVVIGCAVSLLEWMFSFTWDVILKLFFTLLLASLLLYLLFEREYRSRLGRLEERLENLQQCFESLRPNTAAGTRSDDWFSFPIMGREAPTNPGRFERSTQDVVEPDIPGPSKHGESLVEIASPYHVEAHEENTGEPMGQSSKPVAPHSLLKHSDSETVPSQSRIGDVTTNTTTDDHAFRNASSSPVSTGGERRRGGGGDDGGESGDDTHERESEWEREWERELARRASEATG